jgi:hypothetical protein
MLQEKEDNCLFDQERINNRIDQLSEIKKVAIAFADWIGKEDYQLGALNNAYYKWNGMECEGVAYSTEELFQLFNNQP